MKSSVRLNRRVAEQLGCSRTEAEQYIEGGWVTVDTVVTEEPGARVESSQQVALLPGAVLQPVEPVTLLLHKPAGACTTDLIEPHKEWIVAANLAEDDRSGMRFLRCHARGLTLTTALEDSASGLVVLTQDWRIVRKLLTETSRIEQEFVVEVTGTMMPDGLTLLQQGVRWNGKPLASCKVSWQSEHRLRFALKGAERGMIAYLCEQIGLQAMSIKRIRLGRISMGALALGQWRYLAGYERF